MAASAPAPSATDAVAADKIIDGKATAGTIRKEIAGRVAALKESTGVTPGLAVVLVGARPDSKAYVRMKKRACDEAGIDQSRSIDLPATATEAEIVATVEKLNADPTVHGILVQLPLPSHVSEERVLDAISFAKDADGLHPLNAGYLALRGREPAAVACTPKGCMELLKRYGVEPSGKRAVVLGRSNIVGIPMAHLLNAASATVTIAHSRTPDLPGVVREADIVVAAVGRPLMVKGDWLKEGAVVIDVGINRVDDPEAKRGYRLVGDCDFDSCAPRASKITPVPGGVGPMTIAMLLSNTVDAAERVAKAEAGAKAEGAKGGES